jgi:hypothetical protein
MRPCKLRETGTKQSERLGTNVSSDLPFQNAKNW